VYITGGDVMWGLKISWYIGLFSPAFYSEHHVMSPPAVYTNQYPNNLPTSQTSVSNTLFYLLDCLQ